MKKSLLLFLCLLSPLLWSAESGDAKTVPVYKSSDPFSFESIMQLVLGLGLVLGTILLIAWLMRKVSVLPGQHRKMKVVAALSLGHRERAVLVQVGEEQLLLGVAQGQVTLLKSFDQPVIDADPPVVETAFSRKLNQYLNKRSR